MQNLDWSNLGFAVRKTNAVIVSRFADGKWSAPEVCPDLNFNMSCYAGSLHYAISCFEGLKAFRGADDKVRLFRPDENAKRMARTADFLQMPCPSEQMFMDMCFMCVKENIDFLPPFGYNASMYIRPLLMGTNPQLGLTTATEAVFAVMGNPVGTYGGASLEAVPAIISRDLDRAAPNGSGSYKVGANYAASFRAYNIAHAAGYGELLFLDSKTKSKIDEFGSSNFIAIKGNSYVTPLSDSVLPSITNKSLQALAADLGMNVEKRDIKVEELAELDEVNACGTAVVITPICSITDKSSLQAPEIIKKYDICAKGACGEVSRKLYNMIRGIQDGTQPDIHNWCFEL
jgi:branched-chain amino acid aminotransferase, group II